jgi:hypothetical protein
MILSGEVLVEFRSSERSWSWRCESVYKHVTPPGVESSLMNFQTWVRTGSASLPERLWELSYCFDV